MFSPVTMGKLARKYIEENDLCIKCGGSLKCCHSMQLALSAVVELHNPVKGTRGKSGMSKRCTECGFAYPCPTIQAIDKEIT
jgi:tRNA(Ile2) C34 agmatinyltransferase TiaS